MIKKKHLPKLICILSSLFCLLISNLSLATLPPSNNTSLQAPDFFLSPLTEQQFSNATSIDSSQLGWNSPFSFGVMRDSLENYYGTAKYTQKLGEHFAISALLDYGDKTYRYGTTVGFKLASNLIKFSAERLAQVLPFVFDSGSINQRMAQNAYGFKYQHGFDNHILQNIGFGGYYAKAPSKWLTPVSIYEDSAINYRHIAGSTSKGANLSADIKLSATTMATGNIYYDEVKYNTILNNPLTLNDNNNQMGGGVILTQLIIDTIKISAEGTKRAIYDTYKASVSWLPPFWSSVGFELSLIGEQIVSNNSSPNNHTVGLAFSFNPEITGKTKAKYQLPSTGTINDVGIWTNSPAVHMERVLAVADQKTVFLSTNVAIFPNSGDAAGNTKVSISGPIFSEVAAIMFGDAKATDIKLDALNTISCITPPHSAGEVDVSVITAEGKKYNLPKSFVYLALNTAAKKLLVTLNPASAPIMSETEITISGGAGYTDKTRVTLAGKTIKPHKVSSDGTSLKFKTPKEIDKPGKYEIRTSDPAITATPNFNFYQAHTIKSSHGKNGFISPNGDISVEHHADQNFMITPDYGYYISDVLVDGKSVGTPSSYYFYKVAEDHTISATFIGKTVTINASAEANGSISPSGTISLPYGEDQTFTITPKTGYIIADVVVDGKSVGTPSNYTFKYITANHTISTTFVSAPFTINASAGAGGSISPSGTISVPRNGAQTFTITPNTGYDISNVIVDGVPIGTQPSYTFSNITANHTISATFTINTYAIIPLVSGGNGAISPSSIQTVNYGGSKTFTITPASGYYISNVTVNGTSVGTPSSYTFSDVKANHTISVTFTKHPLTINAKADANGSISPSGEISVPYGANQTFNIMPNANYIISTLIIDGSPVTPISTYTFNNVTTNHTISATFINYHTITASSSVEGDGSVSPRGASKVSHGGTITYTFTPSCYRSKYAIGIMIDGNMQKCPHGHCPLSYTFNNVTADHTLIVIFERWDPCTNYPSKKL